MAQVFVSYALDNRDYALKLDERLRTVGFEVWIGNPNDPGEKWWRPTARAIKDCGAFIVIMTPDSLQSELVQLEVSLAVGYDKPIFPLLLDGDVWDTFAHTPYENVRDGNLPPISFYETLTHDAPR